jgi:uncharacterized Rmd1/YagE family protein
VNHLSSQSSRRITVRALLLGDRIDTTGLERPDVLSTTPLCFRVEEGAFVVLFRFGVAVLVGMTPLQEDEIVRSLGVRIVGRYSHPELETAQIEIAPDKDEQIAPNGTITLKALLPEHVLIIADSIATNVILAHDEKNVSAVFDVIEPLARELAEHGRTPGGRRTILKHIGNALLVQQTPDVLWKRPYLERFYAKLEDEYELKERADLLTRKLGVISDTGKVLADIINVRCALSK